MKRALIPLAAVTLIAGGIVAAAHAATDTVATCTTNPKVTDTQDGTGQRITVVCKVPKPPAVTVTATETVTETASPIPEPEPTPTPDPSPTPTPDPTPTEPPPAGDFPDATNTGPTGTLTAYTGPSTINTPGTVIDSKTLGCITVTAPGVIIRNSRITCRPGYAVVEVPDGAFTGTPLLLEDVEIDCQDGGGHAIAEANVTVRRADIHGCENGFDINQNITVEDSYIHDLYNGGDAHMDGIQLAFGHLENGQVVTGARNVTIRHNTIYAVDPAGALGTSAIITNPAGDENILIEGNLLGGGAYTLYCNRPGAGVNFQVTGNHFTKQFSVKYGAFGPSDDCADETLSGNVDHETGQSLQLN